MFSLVILFIFKIIFPCLELFSLFHLACLFMNHLNGFIHILFKVLDISIIAILKCLSCVSAILHFSVPSVERVTDFWWRHIILVVHFYVFVLMPRRLEL